MKRQLRRTAVLVVAAAAVLPAGAAQAQWYSSVSRQPPPLYPYAMPAQRPYAVEVAPNTYVIHRPGEQRAAPRQRARVRQQASAPVEKRRRSKVDPALVEELRQRVAKNDKSKSDAVINTTRIVHKKPIIKETVRYVDDPPRVVERRHYVDEPERPKNKRVAAAEASAGARVINRNGKAGDEKRVISADAEITILGPDRMTIQLYRKGGGPNAKAEALPNGN
jgi:hypothetical protein